MNRNIATLLVDQMENYGIEYVFCVPGASIDAITTALIGRKPKLILCRQESGAGNAAVAYAKKTGKPAVVLVTAGPGATNLVTAAATATLEHNPLIAICGQMDSRTTFKPSHQIINAEDLFLPVTRYSKEVTNPATVSGIWDFAYNKATTGETGTVHLSFAADLLAQPTKLIASTPRKESVAIAQGSDIAAAQELIKLAKSPLIIIGADAATSAVADSLEKLLDNTQIPVLSSFEGGGMVKPRHLNHFMGRLGAFQNQPCNEIIQQADLFIAIGYNIAELDPLKWNPTDKKLIHIANYTPIFAEGYRPDIQLLGNIAHNVAVLSEGLNYLPSEESQSQQKNVREKLVKRLTNYTQPKINMVHPLEVVALIQANIGSDDTLVSDVGSHQYWLSEYFVSHTPRQFINSMGFQTLGVSIPFAVGAAFSNKSRGLDSARVYSVSGDGGVLMCIMELATAVEHQLPIIHLVWKDHSYNLVAIQEEHKYAETSAVKFTHNIDFAEMARSFGAYGITVTAQEQLLPALKEAQSQTGPVIIDIAIDYTDNLKSLVE